MCLNVNQKVIFKNLKKKKKKITHKSTNIKNHALYIDQNYYY